MRYWIHWRTDESKHLGGFSNDIGGSDLGHVPHGEQMKRYVVTIKTNGHISSFEFSTKKEVVEFIKAYAKNPRISWDVKEIK